MKNKWLSKLLFIFLMIGLPIHAEQLMQTVVSIDSCSETGYLAHVKLTNVSEKPITNWKVEFDLPEGQRIQSLSNANFLINEALSGGIATGQEHVIVTNTLKNGNINPQESVMIAVRVENSRANDLNIKSFSGTGDVQAAYNLSVLSQFPLTASYTIDTSWQAGYQATVTLVNNTPNPTTTWSASFSLPSGQSISSFWNGVYSANGQTISVSNPSWIGGGVIPANSSTTFGMIVQKPSSGNPSLMNLQALGNTTSSNTTPIPKAPVLNPVTISATAPNNYTVSWNSSANATSYTLQQDVTNNFTNPVVIVQGAGLSQSFSDQPNGTYYYRVSASNSTGTSSFSNIQSVVIDVQPIQLSAPILNSIDNSNGANQYQVSWGAVSGAQGYILQESTSTDFTSARTIFNGPGTSVLVTNKAPGTYYYIVLAYSGNNQSAESNVENTVVTQQPIASSTFVEGYWESWNSVDSIPTIVGMNVDIIDVAFANFTAEGNHTYAIGGLDCTPAQLTQLVTLAHQAGKKVKISVGGATYPLSIELLTTQDAVGMAQAVAQFVQANSLDGVDYDIEDYPSSALQIALLQNTREQLGSGSIISYTAKTPASTTAPYDQVIQGGFQYVDFVTIMAYDYGSGYTYQQDVAGLMAMGVPASKIV